MAIRHIREAYNQEAGQHSICRTATLDYLPPDKPGQPQKQVITLNIVRFDGVAETIQTPVHEMSANPHEQVRELARRLKARDKFVDGEPPPAYVPPPVDGPESKWTDLSKGLPPAPPPPPSPAAAPPPLPVNPTPKIPPNPWIE